MVTIKEVARHAQVSPATVSKVLTNTPYVSDETRARILRSIEELGYEPSLAARALSKGLTYNIGVIFPYNYDHLFSDPYTLSILEGIEEVSTNNEYNIVLSTPRPPIQKSKPYQRILRSGYLDGLITLETLPNDPIAVGLDEYDYPYVAIGYNAATSHRNCVYPDDFMGAKAIANYIMGLGHERIAIITVESQAVTGAGHRIDGFRAAFEEAALDFNQVQVLVGNFSVTSGYRAATQLLSQRTHPTAILCFNDRMAMGAIQCIQSSGLRVPEDISVVGYDDIPGVEFFTPPLTTVLQPAFKMGKCGAEMLFELITAKSSGKQPLPVFEPQIFPTEIVVRSSATAPKRR